MGSRGTKKCTKKGVFNNSPIRDTFLDTFFAPLFWTLFRTPQNGALFRGFRGYPGGQYPDGSLPAHYTDCKLQSADDMTVHCHDMTTVSRQVSGIFAALRPAHPPRHTARAVQERRGVGGSKKFGALSSASRSVEASAQREQVPRGSSRGCRRSGQRRPPRAPPQEQAMGGSLGGGRPTAGRRHGGSRGKADPGQATPLGAAPEDPHGEAKVVSPLGTGAANGARGGSRDGGWRGRGARWGAGRACWGAPADRPRRAHLTRTGVR